MPAALIIALACAPPAQTRPSITPLARATSSPSEAASPSPSPVLPPLQITAAAFHAGEIGFGYTPASATATGGAPPFTWAIAGGALPTGLAMNGAGAVSGMPTTLGTFLFTVEVTDSGARTASIDTTITIVRRVVVSPTCPTNFPCQVEAGCVTACGLFGNQSGGIAPYTYRVVAGAIPTGMAINGFSLIRAFPAVPVGATKDWLFTVRVTDGIGATAQATALFHVFPHIAFTQASAPCVLSPTVPRCQPTLTYALGTPGLATPPVSLTVKPGLNAPAFTTAPTASASSGTVTVSVTAPACPQRAVTYTWTLTLVLKDGSTCAAGNGAYCISGPATVNVTLAC